MLHLSTARYLCGDDIGYVISIAMSSMSNDTVTVIQCIQNI